MVSHWSPTYLPVRSAPLRMILHLLPTCLHLSPPSPNVMGRFALFAVPPPPTTFNQPPPSTFAGSDLKFDTEIRLIYKQTVWGQRWYNFFARGGYGAAARFSKVNSNALWGNLERVFGWNFDYWSSNICHKKIVPCPWIARLCVILVWRHGFSSFEILLQTIFFSVSFWLLHVHVVFISFFGEYLVKRHSMFLLESKFKTRFLGQKQDAKPNQSSSEEKQK